MPADREILPKTSSLSTVGEKRVDKSIDGRNRANLGVEGRRLPAQRGALEDLPVLDVRRNRSHETNGTGVVGGIRGQADVTRLIEFKERTNGHFVLLQEK
jgi:hypothetical protein